MKFSRFAVHHPVLTIMATLIVIILGAVSVTRLPIDLMPDITYPALSVSTEYEDASPEEIEELEIEISVLSPLREVASVEEIELGKHGIYITQGLRGGCFLPQVATETGWSKEEFLSQCCAGKAGLSPDAWKTGDVKIRVFTAEVFGEKDLS